MKRVPPVVIAFYQAGLALALTAGLASCGGPSTPAESAGAGAPAPLPATAAGRDSLKSTLTAPAPDAADTHVADTAAAKPAPAKPLGKPKAALPRTTEAPLAAAPVATADAVAAAPVPAPTEPAAPAPASTHTQAGRVLDEEGKPLAGATVMLKGSSQVTSTDANGNYSLEVPSGHDTFVFGYGGYADEVATTHDGQPLTVSLSPDPASKVHGRKRH